MVYYDRTLVRVLVRPFLTQRSSYPCVSQLNTRYSQFFHLFSMFCFSRSHDVLLLHTWGKLRPAFGGLTLHIIRDMQYDVVDFSDFTCVVSLETNID